MIQNDSMNEIKPTNLSIHKVPVKSKVTQRKGLKAYTEQVIFLFCSLILGLIVELLKQMYTCISKIFHRFVKMVTYENIVRISSSIYESKLYYKSEMVIFWCMVIVVGILALLCHVWIFLYRLMRPLVRGVYRCLYNRHKRKNFRMVTLLMDMVEKARSLIKAIRCNYVYLYGVVAEFTQYIVEHEGILITLD